MIKMTILAVTVFSSMNLWAEPLPFGPVHYEWLESISSSQVDDFVQTRNEKTLRGLETVKGFDELVLEYKNKIIESQERGKIRGTVKGNYAYNYYTDDKNPKGVYRRTKKDAYLAIKSVDDYKKLQWEVIIDLDAAIKAMNFPASITDPSVGAWVCRYDKVTNEALRCLIGFSNSGGDANLYYEFDLVNKKWVTQNSFDFPILSRSGFEWVDDNTLLVTLDGHSYYNALNPESPLTQEDAIQKGLITKSGYPKHAYIWRRGTLFKDKEPIASAGSDSQYLSVGSTEWDKSVPADKVFFIYDGVTFENYQIYIKQDIDQDGKFETTALDLPDKKNVFGATDNYELIFQTQQDWKQFKNGDVLIMDLKYANGKITTSAPRLFYRLKNENIHLNYGFVSNGIENDAKDDKVFLSIVKDVSSDVIILSRSKDQWKEESFEDPRKLKHKTMSLWEDKDDKSLHLWVESFLAPGIEYVVSKEGTGTKYKIVEKEKEEFDASKYKTEQLWVNMGLDQNGKEIKVPYYIIYDPSKISLKNNKKPAPTRIWAYGGFNVGYTPFYLGSMGRNWLDKGGVYVLANIRGGNEFGPYWHDSAILNNKNNSYKDLIAISEDLIRRGVTSPDKLAIEGGSNGGLLVGAVAALRPDLFKAVISSVPLLDMSRYHKLLVGASWMDEYGNPEDETKDFWTKFSPLHQLDTGIKYPRFFIKTNRNDDRVHPAHARKFSARLSELGVEHDFYEDLQGGHGGTALTSDEMAYRAALDTAFLYRELWGE